MSIDLLVDSEAGCLRWSSGARVQEDVLHEPGFCVTEHRASPPQQLLEDTSYDLVVEMNGQPLLVVDFNTMAQISISANSISTS